MHIPGRSLAGLIVALGLLLAGCASPSPPEAASNGWRAVSGSVRFCDGAPVLSAAQQDRLLRFASRIRETLDEADTPAVLISRTGMDLQRFGIRFSHAGIALRDAEVPWSVRQLYYACDEGRPLLFDQGIAGFVMNTDQPAIGHVSLIMLPSEAAAELARTAADSRIALRLLASRYSANAFPFSTRYQNCNQWVVELLAAGWGGLEDGPELRARAQAWLQQAGYDPEPVILDSHWIRFAATFVPLVHLDDHPEDERQGMALRISLPASIEQFIRTRYPQARRVELCHDSTRVIVREGWAPMVNGCRPAAGDRVLPFSDTTARTDTESPLIGVR